MESSKKGIGRFEKFVLFIVIVLVAYLCFKGLGYNLVERTEEGGFIDRNGTGELLEINKEANTLYLTA